MLLRLPTMKKEQILVETTHYQGTNCRTLIHVYKEFTENAVVPAWCGLQWRQECSRRQPERAARRSVKPRAGCDCELRGEMISAPPAEALPIPLSVCSA